ncbi:MAG: LPXTG cell wall anchor domain-containing protein [Acidimicrobiia bacterium]|nr:LPXTG cell wall anchor domain-containing protein [Acidimicrobiia bacterium]
MTRSGTGNGPRHHRGWLLVAVGLTTILFAALATSASAERISLLALKGSPETCANLGLPNSNYLDITGSGVIEGAGFSGSFTFLPDNTAFDFQVTDGILQKVAVKGTKGPKVHIYGYSGVEGESDTGLTPAPKGKNPVPIAYAYLCYLLSPPTTTTTEEPTTTTEEPTTSAPPVTIGSTTTTTGVTTTTEGGVVTTLGTVTSTTQPPANTSTTVATPTTQVSDTTAAAAGAGALPTTGSGSTTLALVGLSVLLAGAALLATDRRRAIRPLR